MNVFVKAGLVKAYFSCYFSEVVSPIKDNFEQIFKTYEHFRRFHRFGKLYVLGDF